MSNAAYTKPDFWEVIFSLKTFSAAMLALGIAMMDRSPRAYAFMLSGYTTAAVSFPIVNQPELVFESAIFRAEEITVGIFCTALVGRLFLPRHAGSVLSKRLASWLVDCDRLILECLSNDAQSVQVRSDQKKLATDSVDLKNFTTHVSYDTSTLKNFVQTLKLLQRRMVSLIPLLSGIGDMVIARNHFIDETGHTNSKALDQLIVEIKQWIEAKQPLSDNQKSHWRILLNQIDNHLGLSDQWGDLMSMHIATRLIDLAQIRNDCFALQQDATEGSSHKMHWRPYGVGANDEAVYIDYGLGALAALSVGLVVFVTVTFWIMTGWQYGSVAVTMAAIYCCLFAGSDDPAPTLKKFCILLAGVVILAFIIQFLLMPFADGFWSLSLILAAILIPSGVLLAMPSQYLLGMSICVNLPYLMIIQSHYNNDFDSFINNNIASIMVLLSVL